MTPWKLRQAVNLLNKGGVIAYPTETVYGLGCDPLDFNAVTHLCEIKQRSLDKGLILIASTIEQILPYVSISRAALKPLTQKQTRPTSWVIPASDHCPTWLRGKHNGIAVRICTHPVARQLCDLAGYPLVSTSANISQQPVASTPLAIQQTFMGNIDLIIHDECGHQAAHSVIKDLISHKVFRNHAAS